MSILIRALAPFLSSYGTLAAASAAAWTSRTWAGGGNGRDALRDSIELPRSAGREVSRHPLRDRLSQAFEQSLELLQGRLSDHVLRVVTDPDRGLFPKPGEITLTCDCPDWAVMCKHAAAVLYGVGSRLDDRPELLFRLRDVDAEDLVVGDMALPDASAGDDVLAGDLADIFGIDLDPADSGAAAARQKTTGRRRPRRGRPSGFQPTGRRVAELRRRGGFSVPEFAGLLRVSASTVYRWEAGRGPLALRAGQEDALQVLYREIEKRQTE